MSNKWMCTCNKGKQICISPKHQKLYPTEVDEEEICIYCGFYAYAEPSENHELYPLKKIRNGKWLREISRSRSEWYRKFGVGGKAVYKAWKGDNDLVAHGFNDQEVFVKEDRANEKDEWGDYIEHKRSSGGVK